MWTDSHAHLADLTDTLLDSTLSHARRESVGAIVNAATSLASCRTVLRQSEAHAEMLPAVGISPFDTVALPDAWFSEFESLAAHPAVVAVGEIGLDTTNPTYPGIALQLPVFERLLDAARAAHLPAVVHSRGCESTVAELCAAAGPATVVFHCFTGDRAALRSVLDKGYYVSFSGIVTFKSRPLTEAVDFTPLDRMLIETDSPYLAPVPHRGTVNQPAWVPLVGRRVAEIKGVDVDKVAVATTANFQQVFRRRNPPPHRLPEII